MDSSPPAQAMGSTRGLRAVRLSRLNPGLMRRLDEARLGADAAEKDVDSSSSPTMLIQAQNKASAASMPFHKALVASPSPEPSPATGRADSMQKWPLQMAAPSRPLWEGIDPPQGLSNHPCPSGGPVPSQGTSRRHMSLRRLPGEPLGPFDRDKLLDSFSQFRQSGGHLPSLAASTTFGNTRGPDVRDETHLQELEALQQRCLELEATVAELRSNKSRKPQDHTSATSPEPTGFVQRRSLNSTLPHTACLAAQALSANEAAAAAEAELVRMLCRAEEAEGRNEVLVAELAAVTARLVEIEDAANARVAAAAASLRASEAACLGAMEAAKDAAEGRRRAEQSLAVEAASAQRAAGAESAAAAAAKRAESETCRARAAARSRGYQANRFRAEATELSMQAATFNTWRLWLKDQQLAKERKAAEAHSHSSMDAKDASTVRSRVLHGMEASAAALDAAQLRTVMSAWRTTLATRRTVGSLQAALFAEEADRASALRAQRSECDVLLLQAEARHRISLQRLRSELSEAQAKQSENAIAERISAMQAAVRESNFETSSRAADRTESTETEPEAADFTGSGEEWRTSGD